MGKPPYKQKFRKDWVNKPEFKWVRPIEGDVTRVFCVFCKCSLDARLSDLQKHALRGKHKKAQNALGPSQPRITLVNNSKDVDVKKSSEAALALYSAMHTNMQVVDHLSTVCSTKFTGKSAQEIHLHRTKCTGIIKHVLCPHFKQELIEDIGERKFSLILDESTDISVTKYLGVVIRYYSEKREKIVATFMELVPLRAGTAEAIVEAIEKVLNSFQLNIKNLIGIGTDNASVMVGINNGVHAILKRKYQLNSLVLVRCLCHSLQLAVSNATKETLPRNLEFLIRETYCWFCMSSNRKAAYAELYGVINNGSIPLQFISLSDTRWLAIETAMDRILDQWDELKLHFGIVRTAENCYTAEQLYQNYKDPINKVYLTYILEILREVQKTNKSFQSESADPTKLLDDLQNLLKSITQKILIPTAKVNIFTENIENHLDPNPYLGYAFEKALGDLGCDVETKKAIKDRCIAFTVKLCHEMRNRMPSNIVVLQKMKLLHPSESLKSRVHKLSITELALQFIDDSKVVTMMESQWYNLNNVQWLNTERSENFWNEVHKYKNACGENPFQELADFALNLLSLPHANADVERVFSAMNIVKDKLRNRMKPETVNAILTVRYGLKRVGKCCHSYQLPKNVINKVGTMEAYGSKAKNSGTVYTTGGDDSDIEVLNLMSEMQNCDL